MREFKRFAAVLCISLLFVASAAVAAEKSSVQVTEVTASGSVVAVELTNVGTEPVTATVAVDVVIDGNTVRGLARALVMPGQQAQVSVGFGAPVDAIILGHIIDSSDPF